MDQPDPHLLARVTPESPPVVAQVRETRVLWSASEGQVSNAGIYLLAVLTFWLVLPVLYASYRYLRTARHRYSLTDQRFIEESGILVKHVESVELYRVKDISVKGTLLQSIFGRGQVVIQSTDATAPPCSSMPWPIQWSCPNRSARRSRFAAPSVVCGHLISDPPSSSATPSPST